MNDNDNTLPNAAGPIVLFTLLFGIGYAVVRYHLAGPVPWKDLSFFILNKDLSLATFILLGHERRGADSGQDNYEYTGVPK